MWNVYWKLYLKANSDCRCTRIFIVQFLLFALNFITILLLFIYYYMLLYCCYFSCYYFYYYYFTGVGKKVPIQILFHNSSLGYAIALNCGRNTTSIALNKENFIWQEIWGTFIHLFKVRWNGHLVSYFPLMYPYGININKLHLTFSRA